MTDQEREIDRVIKYIRSCRDAGIDTTIAIDKSKNHFILNALEELLQYRSIGTVSECQKAVEKQRAKKLMSEYNLTVEGVWDIARKICSDSENSFSDEELIQIFKTKDWCNIMNNNSAQQAAEKIKNWENSKDTTTNPEYEEMSNIRNATLIDVIDIRNTALIDVIQKNFESCRNEKEVCQLYAEVRVAAEKQMDHIYNKQINWREENNNIVKGYKVFNPDWTCNGYQYEVGGTYEMDDLPVCGFRGFHFCVKAADCFNNFYDFNSENKVAEVIAFGEVDSKDDNSQCCTNKIKIVRKITWQEVLELVNTGKNCTGYRNTGDRNTGYRNTGDKNTGDKNTGDWNTGDWNTGDCNTGDWNTGDKNTGNSNTGNSNTGDCNTGNRNTGDCNTGNSNTGDWNKSSFNTGCFMTEELKISIFNKPSDWSYRDWLHSDARHLFNQIPKDVVEWIYSENMTDEEKAAHPTHETTGGYLKVLDKSECSQLWWDSLSDSQKNIIRELPNFDPEIFKQCTGITVE